MLFFNNNARMAELVDALVSNTCAFTGMPVRLRLRVQNQSESGERTLETLIFLLHSPSHSRKNQKTCSISLEMMRTDCKSSLMGICRMPLKRTNQNLNLPEYIKSQIYLCRLVDSYRISEKATDSFSMAERGNRL